MATNLSDEYVTLRCPQCSGEVEVEQAVFDEHYMEMDGVAVYLGTLKQGDGAVCKHCGTRFQKKQKLEITFTGSGSLHVNTEGGDFIGGNSVNVVQIRHISGVNGGQVNIAGGDIHINQKTCPRCRTLNPPSSRFCQNCGNQLK